MLVATCFCASAFAQRPGGGNVQSAIPYNAVTHFNLEYGDTSERNLLDIYLPEGIDSPPIVMYLHGGGFRAGGKENPAGLPELIDAGIAVASMNYQLSGEAVWPAQLEDIRNAFGFIRENGGKYGYDGTRVASFGGSAGGHLSAMAGIALSDSEKSRLTASVVWFPPIVFSTMDADMELTGVERGPGLNAGANSPESRFIGAAVGENPELAAQASPLTYLAELPADTELPAFLIMHGAMDPLIARGQSGRLFSALLDRRGAKTIEYVLVADGGHGARNFGTPITIGKVVDFLSHQFNL